MRRTGTPGSPHRFPQEALRSTRSPYPLRIDTRGSRCSRALAGVQTFAHPVVLRTPCRFAWPEHNLRSRQWFQSPATFSPIGKLSSRRWARRQVKAPLVERGFRTKGFGVGAGGSRLPLAYSMRHSPLPFLKKSWARCSRSREPTAAYDVTSVNLTAGWCLGDPIGFADENG